MARGMETLMLFLETTLLESSLKATFIFFLSAYNIYFGSGVTVLKSNPSRSDIMRVHPKCPLNSTEDYHAALSLKIFNVFSRFVVAEFDSGWLFIHGSAARETGFKIWQTPPRVALL